MAPGVAVVFLPLCLSIGCSGGVRILPPPRFVGASSVGGGLLLAAVLLEAAFGVSLPGAGPRVPVWADSEMPRPASAMTMLLFRIALFEWYFTVVAPRSFLGPVAPRGSATGGRVPLLVVSVPPLLVPPDLCIAVLLGIPPAVMA